MIKLIASDIDGTLLQNGQTQISQRFFEQARRLMARGTAFCAASGRQYSSLRRLFAPTADGMYFICENGAVVCGPGGRLISRTVIDRDVSVRLCEEILEIPDCELLISGVDTSYLCPKSRDYEDHIRYFIGNNVEILRGPAEMPEDFVKISAYYLPGAEKIEEILAPRWRQTFQVAVAGAAWLDFTLSDKGAGIRALCGDLGVTPAEVMAFGDNYNDVPMLEAVGHPCLMASAAPPLRQRFPVQCRRVEDVLEML